MGKAKPKKEKFGPNAKQMIAASDMRPNITTGAALPVRKVIAYEEQCTSPMKRRQFRHRTDIIDGDIPAAAERSRAFQVKYLKQGWNVVTRPVFA